MAKTGPKPKSAPAPKKKTNRDKVNDEIIKISRKNSGVNKLPIILAIFGVVLLVAVGGLIFFLTGDSGGSGGVTPPPDTGFRANVGGAPAPQQGAQGQFLPPPVSGELNQKIQGLLTRLDDEKDSAGAIRELSDMLKSGGEAQVKTILPALGQKAKSGNKPARDLLREAAGLFDNPLAQNLAINELGRLGESLTDATSSMTDPTNLLPVDTQALLSLSVRRILSSGYERGLFTFGAFRLHDFGNRLGIPLGNIDKLAIGCNKEHGHILGIVRTIDTLDWDEVKTKLHVDSEEHKTSRGKTYYMGKVDFLAEFLAEPMPAIVALKDKAAVWKMNDRTLVYGDEETVKELIDNPPAADPSEDVPEVADTPPASGGPPPMNQPAGGQPAADRSAGGGGAGAMELTPPPPMQDDQGAGTPGGPPTGRGGVGGAGTGAGGSTTARTYRRIDARLRQVVEAAEQGQEVLGVFADSAVPGRLGKTQTPAANLFVIRNMPAAQIEQIEKLALAVPPLDEVDNNPTVRGALLCRDRRSSGLVKSELDKVFGAARDSLKELMGFDFRIGNEGGQTAQTATDTYVPPSPGGSGGFGPPAMGGSGGGPPAMGGGGPPAMGGAGGSANRPPTQGSGGGGGPGAAMGRPTGAGTTGPGAGGFLDQPEERFSDDNVMRGHVSIERADELVLIVVTVYNKKEGFFEGQIGNIMVRLRGQTDMAAGKVRVGDLAQGYLNFRNARSAAGDSYLAPPGIARRAPNPSRGPRPFPPSDCVSWMPALLDYLPGDRYQNLASEIDPNASWRDPRNAAVGRIVVSPFLVPNQERPKTHVRVRGVEQPLAVTDFVGMAGVGPDAPYYDISDRRAGVFGYYRQTRLEDVRDGASNTIYMIQSDSSVTGPWIAGGGSTVRGTSLNGDRDVGVSGGFRSPNYKGKPGVWVVMVDGSARFLTKDISPSVFKALCTINGSDDSGEIDLLAPKQKLEVTPSAAPGTPGSGAPRGPAGGRPRSTIRDDD